MKPTSDGILLDLLETIVSTTLKHWLDENREALFASIRAAILDGESVNRGKPNEKSSEFLTVAEVAQRWQLNPETVRRMIRDGRIPTVLAGRHRRVARATVDGLERSGKCGTAEPSRWG